MSDFDSQIAEIEAANGVPDAESTLKKPDPKAEAPAAEEAPADDDGDDGFNEDQEADGDSDDPEGADEADEADDTDEADDDSKKKRRSKPAKERIGELTAEKHEERRLREAAEARAKELEARLSAFEKGSKPLEQDELKPPVEPKPDDYDYGESDPGYIEARQDYKLDKRDYERALADRAVSQDAQKVQRETQQQQEIRSAIMQGVSKAETDGRAKYQDFDAKISEAAKQGALPPMVTVGISVSPVGGDLVYRLATDAQAGAKLRNATNPQNVALALGELEGEYIEDTSDGDLDMSDPLDMARAMGRMRARVAGKKAVSTPNPTNAPEPPSKRIKGGSGSGLKVSPDTDNIDDFMQHYGKDIGL